MIKNPQQLRDRKKFVKNCINNPRILSKRLKATAKRIDTNKTNIVDELADLMYISKQTIYNDMKK